MRIPIATDRKRIECWTKDSPILEAIYYINDITPGSRLFQTINKSNMPIYRLDMSRQQFSDFLAGSLIMAGLNRVELGEVREKTYDGHRGFQQELSFLSKKDIEYNGIATGCVAGNKLNVILYLGTKEVYYDLHKPAVDALLESIKIKQH